MTLKQTYDASNGHYAREWGHNEFRGEQKFLADVEIQDDGSIILRNVNAFEVGAPTGEESGINVDGTTYGVGLRVNRYGSEDPAELIANRHSTTLPAVMLGARSYSNDENHAVLPAQAAALWLLGVAWTGTKYNQLGYIGIEAADETLTDSSSPGRLSFYVTPTGAKTPALAARIEQDKTLQLVNGVQVAPSQDKILAWLNPTEVTDQEVTGSGGTAGTYAAGGYVLEYTRRGNMVRVDAVLFQITDKGSWSGDVRLGVPFTCANDGNVACHGQVVTEHHTVGTNMVATIVNGQDFVRIRFSNTGTTSTFLQWSDLATAAGNAIRFSIEFPVAAS